jgi:hypothetical protein
VCERIFPETKLYRPASQAAAIGGVAIVDPMLAFMTLVIGALVVVGLVAIVGGFLQARRERLLTHQERLKALELGREIPDDGATATARALSGAASDGKRESSGSSGEASGSLSRKCFSTALWVAFWGFLFAAQSDSVPGRSPTGTAVAIAIAASVGAIGVTAMICGTILASRTPIVRDQRATGKPEFDSDALDVVSRRG